MRATTALAGVSFAFVLTGCGTLKESDGQTVRCRDRHANINHQSGRLEVRPETIELCTGFTLTLELHPPVATGSARTKQSGSGNNWLDRQNTDALIVLTPPNGTSTGPIKYTVEVDGVGVLDPRIVVQ
jgi:hypothetical protein